VGQIDNLRPIGNRPSDFLGSLSPHRLLRLRGSINDRRRRGDVAALSNVKRTDLYRALASVMFGIAGMR
jgi:hypothetical protein